jgi:hypothetical protein
MACVVGTQASSFEPVELPTGRIQLPDWVRGAHVNWMLGASNAPTLRLKVLGNIRSWPDQTWVKEGAKCYISRHPDGRAEVLYHDGAISTAEAWRVIDPACPASTDVSIRSAWNRWHVFEFNPTEPSVKTADQSARNHLAWLQERGLFSGRASIEVRDALVTTKQGGFGGDHYPLNMQDGSLLVLRGPWHGGAPAGYVEVNPIDVTAPYYQQRPNHRQRPWHKLGGTCSYISEDLFLRIVATHAPHAGVAYVSHPYGRRMEPFDHRWEMPKASIYDLEWGRAQRAEPAGPFWGVYWDASERYCGSLRIPAHGFRSEVWDLPALAKTKGAKL